MTKQKYVCRYCGSEDILEDAFARWDVQTQQFELSSTHGNAVCENEDCEAQQRSEVDIGEWINIEEPKTCPVPGRRGCSILPDGTCPAIGCPAPKPKSEPEIGPVPIITAAGVHPENLDKIIEDQKIYYHDQPDQNKRGFTPK